MLSINQLTQHLFIYTGVITRAKFLVRLFCNIGKYDPTNSYQTCVFPVIVDGVIPCFNYILLKFRIAMTLC